MRRWRVAGINFDHFHMGDLLRMAFEHPAVEIVGVSDEQPVRTESAADATWARTMAGTAASVASSASAAAPLMCRRVSRTS